MAVPPGAIIVSTQGENSSANKDLFVIRCETTTAVPVGARLISISFCSKVNGSTGALAISPFSVGVISTATLSGAHVAIDLPGPSNTVSSAELKFFFARSTQLFGIFLEEILPTHEPVANDPRPNVRGNDQFNLTVADSIAVFPSFVFCLLHFDLGCGRQ